MKSVTTFIKFIGFTGCKKEAKFYLLFCKGIQQGPHSEQKEQTGSVWEQDAGRMSALLKKEIEKLLAWGSDRQGTQHVEKQEMQKKFWTESHQKEIT